MLNYYDILNVPYTATIGEIRISYRKMAKRYHPDLSPDKSGAAKFKLITEAYQVLGNHSLKTCYDQKIMSKKLHFEGNNSYIIIPRKRVRFASSFKNLAESGLLAQKRLKRQDRLQSFGYDVSITIKAHENKRGVAVNIPLPAKGICYVCYGAELTCYLCEGMGKYSFVGDLGLTIPANMKHNSVFEINISKYQPSKEAFFTMKLLKILIDIL